MNPTPPARDSVGYIPWWLLAAVALAFLVAAAGLAAFVAYTRPADLPAPTATAVVVTAPLPAQLPPTPTRQAPAAAATETAAPEPTAPPPPPPAGQIQPGNYVQVTGTGSDGFLNLRAEPSLESPVNYLALEREVLQVQAGPAEGSGLSWWYLVDPATNTRFGWAVENYLQVVQGP